MQPTLSACHCGGRAAYTADRISCVRCGHSVRVSSEFVIKPESAMRERRLCSMTPEERAFLAAWKACSAWDGKITKPVLKKAIEAYVKEIDAQKGGENG